MLIETLATKYRPKIWSDIVGQDTTVNRLKNIISNGKIPNAFLLTGNSGTGKTTLSRILAAYLSCDSEKEVKKFVAKDCPDIIEINAGADGKVDDIRELINAARFKPQQSKYKIVCIDECQSLLISATNCLLKPLEEPPKHTIYILSSMQPDKLNQALVSRCTPFNLSSVNAKDLSKRLLEIGELEKFKWLDKEVALKISQYANGSVRQAISNLEAVAQSITEKRPKDIDKILESVLNVSDATYAQDILKAIYKQDLSKLNSALLSTDNLVVALNKMSYLNMYVIDNLTCPNNKKVAHWGENKSFYSDIDSKILKDKNILKYLIAVQLTIDKIKNSLGSFMANERSIALTEFYQVIKYGNYDPF